MHQVLFRPSQTANVLVLVLLLIIIGLPACQSTAPFRGKMTFTEANLYQRNTSPSGEWELIVLAEAGWAFGPHKITVLRRAADDGSNQGHRITQFSLYNDGANLHDGNCSVTWHTADKQEIAMLSCNGQEQDPQQYEIDISTGKLLSTTDPNAK